jgi:hypothetical protein
MQREMGCLSHLVPAAEARLMGLPQHVGAYSLMYAATAPELTGLCQHLMPSISSGVMVTTMPASYACAPTTTRSNHALQVSMCIRPSAWSHASATHQNTSLCDQHKSYLFSCPFLYLQAGTLPILGRST